MLAILIFAGISFHLLVEISALHILTSFGWSHRNCTVWFSVFTFFVRPSMVACSCFYFSRSSCTVRLFASSVFVWLSMVVWSCFCFSRSSCTVRLFVFCVFVRSSTDAWSCFCFSLLLCRTLSFVSSCFIKLLMTPSDCWSLDWNSSSSNFNDLNAASEIWVSAFSCSCSYK